MLICNHTKKETIIQIKINTEWTNDTVSIFFEYWWHILKKASHYFSFIFKLFDLLISNRNWNNISLVAIIFFMLFCNDHLQFSLDLKSICYPVLILNLGHILSFFIICPYEWMFFFSFGTRQMNESYSVTIGMLQCSNAIN